MKITPQPFYRGEVFQVSAFVILVIIAVWGYLHHLNQPGPAPVGMTVIATPAKALKSIPKVTRTVKNGAVRVYASPAKIKLDLPDDIVKNDAQSVVASTTVKGDDHPQTTSTIINTDTGEFETVTRRDPYPWLAWDDHGKVGVYAGLNNGQPAVKLEAEQGIFQVKAVHFGLNGHIVQEYNPPAGESGTTYFIGAGGWYRW